MKKTKKSDIILIKTIYAVFAMAILISIGYGLLGSM